MRLAAVTIQKFKNIVDPQRIVIEPDVTGLVGKNESGKTTVLKALHRLNPANGTSREFDLTTEYPRWRLARDRRSEDLGSLEPIEAEFELDDTDIDTLAGFLPAAPPSGVICRAARSYDNEYDVSLTCQLDLIIRSGAEEASADAEDVAELLKCDSLRGAQKRAKELAKELKESSKALRAKAMTSCATALEKREYLV